MKEKRLYIYTGAVFYFDTLVSSEWNGRTFAVSEKQATNNLAHQFKKKMGYTSNAQVRLDGKPELAM